ncbi:VanW family protein [Deinococcus sp.]|uniref:VanW family protein n=1 Tax=Deinococcus sp. TaxID=47478 RepID=UPI002869AC87|nr:VanW family protein [Deinococcus sp.]
MTAGRMVALRWTVPEPRLIRGKVERPLLNREARLTLNAAQTERVKRDGSLDSVQADLDRVYAQVEARTPRDIRFLSAGGSWIGEARTGWAVDRAASAKAVLAALKDGAASIPLSITLIAPARSVRWAAARSLQHLGSGDSEFTGSPDFRVHNIRVGAARVHGAWIEPGATFSFNALVGPISAATGFQPGYVVTGDTLSTEDGGGICQVSTTVFRAALRAGLPITERHAHSYQVAYYGDPGLDATVYAPAKDLRWRNDTAAPVLVQAAWTVDSERLTVSVFGRSDGRRVQIAEPVITQRQPAPDPTFVADRTLEKGGARRIDMPAAGLRARVKRTVTFPDGRQRTDTVDSRYRAWGGVFAVPPGDDRLR